jgi:hypothetical protein
VPALLIALVAIAASSSGHCAPLQRLLPPRVLSCVDAADPCAPPTPPAELRWPPWASSWPI